MLKVLSHPRVGPEFQPPFQLSISTGTEWSYGWWPASIPQCDQKWISIFCLSGFFVFILCFIFFFFRDLVGVVNTARLSISVCCQLACGVWVWCGQGIEGSRGIWGLWATLPWSNHSSLAGSKGLVSGLSIFGFQFSVFGFGWSFVGLACCLSRRFCLKISNEMLEMLPPNRTQHAEFIGILISWNFSVATWVWERGERGEPSRDHLGNKCLSYVNITLGPKWAARLYIFHSQPNWFKTNEA